VSKRGALITLFYHLNGLCGETLSPNDSDALQIAFEANDEEVMPLLLLMRHESSTLETLHCGVPQVRCPIYLLRGLRKMACHKKVFSQSIQNINI
jgi:hypothetical protein